MNCENLYVGSYTLCMLTSHSLAKTQLNPGPVIKLQLCNSGHYFIQLCIIELVTVVSLSQENSLRVLCLKSCQGLVCLPGLSHIVFIYIHVNLCKHSCKCINLHTSCSYCTCKIFSLAVMQLNHRSDSCVVVEKIFHC